MKPALFTYPFVSSYPVMMLLGFVAAWLLSRHRAKLFQIDRKHLDNLGLLLPISGLFGARFFARLFYAKLPLLEALKVWEGDGLVFYGGFLVSTATVLAYGLFRKVNLLRLCDCLAPGVAVGLSFGRIGCFLAGCCWGDLCADTKSVAQLDQSAIHQLQTVPAFSTAGWPLSVRFPPGSEPYKQHRKLGLITGDSNASLPVHPVQLYEAVLAAALATLLHRNFRTPRLPGNASLALLTGYAVIRFFTEYLRADNRPYWHDLTISQVISVEILAFCILAVFCGGLLRVHAQKRSKVETLKTSAARAQLA